MPIMIRQEKQLSEVQPSPKSPKISAPERAHEKESEQNAKQFVSGGMLNHTQNISGMLSGCAERNGLPDLATTPEIKDQLESSKGTGDVLTAGMQRKMKQQFGGDWGDVRVHHDSRAFEMTTALEANAFAYGRDIYFAQGKYDAQTSEGQELLGHELTHVAQQKEWSEPMVQRSATASMVNGAPVVKAHIYYYGNEASEAVAKAATDEINTMWNEPKGQVAVNGKDQTVTFDIKYSVVDEDTAHAKAHGNSDVGNNFVRIEKDKNNGPIKNVSFMKRGENAGHWLTADNLGTSTTAAHEFGHGFGLIHAPNDMRGKGQPGIMAARGTMVDADYTYAPDQGDSHLEYDKIKKKNVPKNTVDPKKRKVTQSDIDHVRGKAIIDILGNVTIGTATNKMLDAMGNVIKNKNDE